jgi:hypothetical protein
MGSSPSETESPNQNLVSFGNKNYIISFRKLSNLVEACITSQVNDKAIRNDPS